MRIFALLLALFCLAFLTACGDGAPDNTDAAAPEAVAEEDPDIAAAGSGMLPDGWQARFDKEDASLGDVQFAMEDGGYHVTSGPAAIYYDATDMAQGDYTVRTTFNQLQEATHPEAYGLFVGGSDLQGAGQQYIYFLVRQDGKYLIKHRNGAETENIVGWTDHEAINQVGEDGMAENTLAVVVDGDQVRFEANGTAVATMPKADLPAVDGQAGLRINHNLDVRTSALEIM